MRLIKDMTAIEVIDRLEYDLKVIQEVWYNEHETYLSTIENVISLIEVWKKSKKVQQ